MERSFKRELLKQSIRRLGQELLKLRGRMTRSKNFKTPFFQDIQDSFHEVADMGLEPHQKIF